MKITKQKAIAIPVVTAATGDQKFLTARDRRFQEWLFITGGSRRREVNAPLKTALRELEEETRGVVQLKRGEYTEYSFTIDDDGVELVYNVFILFCTFTEHEQNEIIRKFGEEQQKTQLRKARKEPVKRVYDENDVLAWETLADFEKHEKKWALIVDNVILSNKFYESLRAQNEDRKTFCIQ